MRSQEMAITTWLSPFFGVKINFFELFSQKYLQMSKKKCNFATETQKRNRSMPIVVQVPVDIPATKTISYEFLSNELTRYAQSIVDSEENLQLPLISEEELKRCIPLDKAFDQLRAHIHERFKTRIEA